nr:lipocalin 1 [Lonomia obliqua]
MKFFGLFLAILASTAADVVIDGACPDMKAVSKFDMNAYQGTWYEIKKFPVANEANGDCGSVEYTPDNGLLKVRAGHVEDDIEKFVVGVLTKNAGTSDAELTLSVVVGDYVRVAPLWIVSTDYDNYAIGYSCKDYKKSNQHRVNIWILSRTKTLTETSKSTVNKFLKEHSKEFDQSKFVETDFSEKACFFKKSHVYTVPFGA